MRNGFIWAAPVLFVLSIILTGCVSAQGNKAVGDPEKVKQLKVGVSTKNDVQQVFGPPTKTNFYEGGDETWEYVYNRAEARATNFVPYVGALFGGSDSEMATLTLRFGGDGVLKQLGAGSSTGGGGGLQDLGR
jgi:outer membrane protein assembly factor BamE (lipoprotein component of BamABCDE complex)